MMISTTKTAPTYINRSFTQTTAGANTVINKPTNTLEGDLLISAIQHEGPGILSANTYTVPTGWTEVLDGAGFNTAWKIASASEPTSYTFTSSITSASSGYIITIRNGIFGSVAPSAGISSTGNIIEITGLNNAYALLIAEQQYYTADTWTLTDNTWTSLTTDNDGTAPSWAVWYKNNLTGSTGTSGITITNSRTFRAFTYAILPK